MLGIKVQQEDAEGANFLHGAAQTQGRGVGAELKPLSKGPQLFGYGALGAELGTRQRERGERIRGEVAQRGEVRAQRRAERDKQLRIRELEKGMRKDADALADPNLGAEDRAKLEASQAAMRRERAALTGEDSEAATMVTPEQAAAALASQPRFGVARPRLRAVEPTVSAPPGAAVAAASGPVSVQQSNVFNINGGNPNEVRRVVKEELNAQLRRTAAAIARPAGA